MAYWYCEKHEHLDKNPNALRTLFNGMKCHINDCNNKLDWSKDTIKTSNKENK